MVSFLSLAVLVVFITISALLSCNIWLTLTLGLMLITFFTCYKNINKHIFLILYLMSFFTFLVGRQVVHDYFGYASFLGHTTDEYNALNLKLFINLFGIVVGYAVSQFFHVYIKRSNGSKKIRPKDERIKVLSLYSNYFLVVPYAIDLIEGILVVRQNGYVAYYTYTSHLPWIVTELSTLYLFSFLTFLATFPTKKEARLPVRIFIILTVLNLFTGRRLYFVTQFLILFGYAFLRNKEEEKWLLRKHIIIIVCSLPAFVIFLYSYRFIRYKQEIAASSLVESFLHFFQQQGYSATLITQAQRYKIYLGDNNYSFHSILRFLNLNPISRYLLKLPSTAKYIGDAETLAIRGGSLANTLSYYILGRAMFLKGYGTGGCYIASLFQDYGYIGLLLGGFAYGITLKAVSNIQRGRVYKNAILLIMFFSLLRAPRYNFDTPYYALCSYGLWMYFGALYFVSSIMKTPGTIRKYDASMRIIQDV